MAGPRPVRAPRGSTLTCRGWQQEAAMRMLHEQPRPGGCRAPRRPRRLRRHRACGALVGRLRRDDPHAHDAGRRRDDARAIGQAGRRVPHQRVGAACADRQFQPGAGVGQLGRVPSARGAGTDDVRTDDRRFVDLHRHARDPAGHLRVLRRDRPPQVRRHARRHDHADRRARWHGRRPAVGCHDERWRGAVHRRRCMACRPARRDPISRRGRRFARRCRRPLRAGP